MPLLKPSTRRSATSSSPTGRRAASRRVAVGDAVQVGDVAHELARGQPGRHGLVLGHERHAARAPGGRGAGRGRSTRTVPWLTPTSPVMARISVVLPAPFGPSRPVTPGPNEQLSSDSATFCPNHTETSRDLDGRRRRRTPGRPGVARRRDGRQRGRGHGGDISAPPSGSGAAARRCRRRARRRRSPTASSPPWSTPPSGDPAVDVAEEDEVAQVQRQRRAR